MRTIADYDGTNYRSAFWEGEDREYEDKAERTALKRLLPAGERLLELGAGFGRLTNLYTGFKQVVLVDYNRAHLEQAANRYGQNGYRYIAADIYHLPFAPGQFDVVTMIRTIHHLGDPLAAIQQTRMVTHRDGVFILEYSNKRNTRAMVRWFSAGRIGQSRWGSVIFNPFSQEMVEFAPNYYGFHPRHVLNMLKEAGFKPGRHLAVSSLRLRSLKRLLPLRILVQMDALLQPMGGWCQLAPSGLIRAVATGDDPRSSGDVFWRCPACEGSRLEEAATGVYCQDCGHAWPVRDGIYDFRLPVTRERLVAASTIFGW